MRTAFMRELVERGAVDDRVSLVVGDLGFGVIEGFSERFPDRYVNAGVAEQDMVGIATGMALSGAVVVTYSIVNFAVLRCLEQIRNDVCYHDADVKIAAVGGGLAYGALGMTHHGTEDIAILRTMPNMRVLVPADAVEAAWAARTALTTPGPFFVRLGRNGEPAVHATPPTLELGRAATLREGSDATLIGAGNILCLGLEAADLLAARGISLRVLSMHTVSPLDEDAILAAAGETRAVVTLEEHSVLGGLGGAVAEVLAERGGGVPFKRIGLPPRFVDQVGSQDYLRAAYGLTADAIAGHVTSLLEREGRS